jgi:hypothetical protein
MSKSKKNNLILSLSVVTIIAVLFTLNERDRFLEKYRSFRLSDIPLQTVYEMPARIPEGANGYVVFYTGLLECRACLRRMSYMGEISEIYDDVAFYAILRDESSPLIFEQILTEFAFPGEYLVDEEGKISGRLNLGDYPLLLFFNSDQELFYMIPMNMDHTKLKEQIHRTINMM